MKYAIFTLLMFANCQQAAAAPEQPVKINESSFQCGSLYGLFWGVWELKPDMAKAALYERKYRILANMAEEYYLSLGKTKEEAQAYMDRHGESLAKQAATDTHPVFQFEQYCDIKFKDELLAK